LAATLRWPSARHVTPTREANAVMVAMLEPHKVFSRTIAAVLEHVRDHGGIQGFPGTRQERLAFMKAATEQGLIVWNKTLLKYDLTVVGQRRLAAFGAGCSELIR
jgi:hypothetical protein